MGTIGQPIPRVEDDRFLRGAATYTGDLSFGRMAWLVLVRSTVAHAEVRSINVEDALSMPGVLGTIGLEDLEQAGVGTFSNRIRYAAPDGSPMFEPPRSPLARGRVRYVGEPIVAIVAESLGQAQDAADSVVVDYEELPPAATIEAALSGDAPIIWDQAVGNIAFEHRLGNSEATDAAFAQAAHVTALDLRINRVTASPMEPRVAVARPDLRQGRMILYATTQTPHSLRTELSEHILGVPAALLRVVALDVGGAFGMKSNDFSEYALCILAAQKFGRPVKWMSSRSEAFLSDHHARDNLWRVELALDRNHDFLALRSHSRANLGAYLAYAGTHQATNNVGGVAGLYRIPAMSALIHGVYTNTQPVSPYRGAGRPEATFAIERVIELAAAELQLDPVELRRQNLIQPEEMPYKTGLVFTYDSGNFPVLLETVLSAGDWEGFDARRKSSRAAGKLRGRGLALAIEIAGGPPGTPFEEYASLTIDPSGSAFAQLGTHSQGQGHETAFRQILSERLHLGLAEIHLTFGDTDKVPHGKGTFGSRSIGAAGAALETCYAEIVDKAKRIAGHHLECAVEDIEFRSDGFFVAGSDRSISLRQVAALAYTPARLPSDLSPGLSAAHTVSTKGPTFPNSAHVCEIEIDIETGLIKVERYLVVDDVGTIINPLLVYGQIHGGVAQGLGQALLESIVHGDDGQLLTGSFQDYAMPRADDLPSIGIESRPVPTGMNPLGAKGAGEAGAVGALAAVVNAVCNALAEYGVRHIDPPITSEKVWRLISGQKAKPPRA